MPGQSKSFEWVRDEDLSVTVYDLRIVNPATNTKASSLDGAEITELSPSGLSLRVPRELCSTGHMLSIELTFRRLKPEEKAGARQPAAKPVRRGAPKPKVPGQVVAKLVTTGKVAELSPIDRKSIEVTIKFYQYDEAAWSAFCADHVKRQLRVDAIMRRRQE